MRSGDIRAIVAVVDKFSRPLRKVARQFRDVGDAGRRMGRSVGRAAREAGLDRLTRSFGRLRGAASNAYTQVSRLLGPLGRYAALGATIAGGALTFGVLQTGSAFEGMGIQLEALEGSAAAAKAAMAWIVDFTAKTPLQLTEVSDAYAALRNFGMDPTNGSLRAMVDTMAMSGKGSEHLSGIILALGQAWTKQKLQGEEALQLLERGVPVWDLLSNATGKSVAELQKLASAGRLGREHIALLIELMGDRAEGASERFSQSFAGILSNLQDMFTRFQKMIADAGIFEAVKAQLGGILEQVNAMEADGRLAIWAKDVSDAMLSVVSLFAGFVRTLMEVDAEGRTALGRFMDDLTGFVRGARNFVDMIGGWKVAMGALAAVVAGPLIASLVTLGGAIASVVTALLATPIGAIIAAIAVGAFLIIDNWSTLKGWFETFFGWFGTSLSEVTAWLKDTFGWAERLFEWLGKVIPLVGQVQGIAHAVSGFFGAGEAAPGAASSGADVGAARAAQRQQDVAVRNRIDLTVRHENAPKGTRLDVRHEAEAPAVADTGLAMAAP